MTWWADANARARGLSGHLLDEAAWRRVRLCSDVPTLCRELQRLGYPLEPGDAPRTAERALDRVRAARQAVLAQWLGSRVRCFRVHLEADDFRAVRALLRAAAGDVPAADPSNPVPPAAGLSDAMRTAAAAAGTPEDALAVLVDRGQSLAARALEEHRTLVESWPDLPPLIALEQALLRAFAGRALEGARHGGRELVRRVRRAIDVTNARAVLALGSDGGLPAGSAFVEGGEALTAELFADALGARDAEAARALLGAGLPRDLGAALADPELSSPRFERALLVRELASEHHAARQDPLGPAPVLAFLVRQQLEAHDLRGLLWARALGAPPDPERWT